MDKAVLIINGFAQVWPWQLHKTCLSYLFSFSKRCIRLIQPFRNKELANKSSMHQKGTFVAKNPN